MPPKTKLDGDMEPTPKLNFQLVWAVVVVIVGLAFAAGAFKGTSTVSATTLDAKVEEQKTAVSALQALSATQYQALLNKVDNMVTQFNTLNATNGERLKGVEDSVTQLKGDVAEIKAQQRLPSR